MKNRYWAAALLALLVLYSAPTRAQLFAVGATGGDCTAPATATGMPNLTCTSVNGKAVTLSGNLVIGGALTTTGTGPTTLAFPSATATFTFPSASKTLMASDYSNGTTLTANAMLTGGGVGAAPNAVALTGLVKGNGASAPTAYAGTSCTNQFPRSLDANGAATCNSIVNADITAGTIDLTTKVVNSLPKANGGTGSTTGQGAAKNLSLGYVLCQSAVQQAHTGDTTETTLATCTVPADALGANGRLRISALFSYTNSANNKTLRVRYSGASGTQYVSAAVTTTATIHYLIDIANRNATNSQVGIATGFSTASSSAVSTSAVDTTASTTIVITGQLASSGESVNLEDYAVVLMSSSAN